MTTIAERKPRTPSPNPRFRYYISDRCGNIAGNQILVFENFIAVVLKYLRSIKELETSEPMPGRVAEIGIAWDDFDYLTINASNISTFRYVGAVRYPNGSVEVIQLMYAHEFPDALRVFMDYGNDELRRNKWKGSMEFYDIEKEMLVATAYFDGGKYNG